MTKSFAKYLKESFTGGAAAMDRDPVDAIISPDTKRANPVQPSMSSGPSHWNNSPFLSGGRLTSAFGMNPEKEEKKKILTYEEFVKATSKLSK